MIPEVSPTQRTNIEWVGMVDPIWAKLLLHGLAQHYVDCGGRRDIAFGIDRTKRRIQLWAEPERWKRTVLAEFVSEEDISPAMFNRVRETLETMASREHGLRHALIRRNKKSFSRAKNRAYDETMKKTIDKVPSCGWEDANDVMES